MREYIYSLTRLNNKFIRDIIPREQDSHYRRNVHFYFIHFNQAINEDKNIFNGFNDILLISLIIKYLNHYIPIQFCDFHYV